MKGLGLRKNGGVCITDLCVMNLQIQDEGPQNKLRSVITLNLSTPLEQGVRFHITGWCNDYCKLVPPVYFFFFRTDYEYFCVFQERW